MSHFSLLVSVSNHRISPAQPLDKDQVLRLVEPLVAPFDSRITTYFVDLTREARRRYHTAKVDAVLFPDGSIISLSDPRFTEHFALDSQKRTIVDRTTQAESEASQQLKLTTVPADQLYLYDEFCEKETRFVQLEGVWGKYLNKTAQFSSYTLGSRSPLKLMTEASPKGSYAFKKDVLWSKMKELAVAENFRLYRAFQQAATLKTTNLLDGAPYCRIVPEGIQRSGKLVYRDGETLADFLDRRGMAPEVQYAFYPDAFIDKNGRWHDREFVEIRKSGSWFAQMQTFLQNLDDEDLLVVLDCIY